jgi:formate C-acetyltransferase
MAAVCEVPSPVKIWSPSEALSPRVKRLRDEFWAFYRRDYYRNEVRPYTTGTRWDQVYSLWNWSNVPEMFTFFEGAKSYLLAAAEKVALPPGFWDEPLIVRRAILFKRVVEQLPVKILDGELVVGAYFNTAISRGLTQDEARARQNMEHNFLAETKTLNRLGVGNCGAVPGHLIPNYPKVLQIGWKGIRAEAESVLADAKAASYKRDLARAIVICADAVKILAERYAAEAESVLATPPLLHGGGARGRGRVAASYKRDLARAIVICADAVKILAERYAAEAERLAGEEANPNRRAELLEIARICRKVPWEPATTLPEALQSLWFTHMLLMAAESYPGPGVSPGRIDQYLYPFYRADLEAGRLTREQAKEWLECCWIKHNYVYDFQGRVGTNQGINSSFGQLITLGGMDANGEDSSNELTYLCLDVIEDLNLLEPKPNIRLHAQSPDRLLDRLTAMIAKTQGSPFLLNFDENAIRGLAWEGLPESELWDYAPVGCLENTLQGCDRSGTVDVNLNIAKAIELALNDGKDMTTGEQIGPKTGDPRRFADFAAFFTAFKTQLKAEIDRLIACNDIADSARARFEPTPYVSALVDGCLESGRDVTAGGAKHNFITVEGVALATAVDSLAAVKKLVFEDKRVTMDELLRALKANFDGCEALRQMLLNKAPKYGNDDPHVDDLAREVSQFWTTEAFKHTTPETGKRYRGGYLSWNYWVSYAPNTAATPDGRLRGQFLSNAVRPVNGADRKGPTAAIKSVGRLGLETAPNGASHTISLSPSLVRDAEHRQKLAALLRAYGQVGGTALQINVIDSDTLRAAQKDPDAYRNLLVRVTGYNAYFVMLGKEIQDEIIARESHAV